MYLKGGDAVIETAYGWVSIEDGRLESVSTGMFDRTEDGCFFNPYAYVGSSTCGAMGIERPRLTRVE